MNRSLILPTVITGIIGLAGVLLLLFAWHLPPFAPAMPTTENAYLRGNVTTVAPQLSGYLSAVEVTDFQTGDAGLGAGGAAGGRAGGAFGGGQREIG